MTPLRQQIMKHEMVLIEWTVQQCERGLSLQAIKQEYFKTYNKVQEEAYIENPDRED